MLIKALHSGGAERWHTLVRETASMWVGYERLGSDELRAIHTPVLVLAGDQDDFVPIELVCPYTGRCLMQSWRSARA
jgi:pimeloyl-ACP methyl ester carboxylesterase